MSVLVVGNCTVDVSFAVPRFPRPGETLLATQRSVDLGGKGANQAVAARRFGVEARLAAPVGRDPEGDWACARLLEEGLPADGILRSATTTDQSILYVAPDGQNMIVSSREAAASAGPVWARSAVAAAPAGHLLVQGNLSLETTCAALAEARGRGMPTLVNPAPIQYPFDAIWPLTDIAVLNEVEAAELGRRDDPLAAGEAIRSAGVGTVIVTLGRDGAALFDGGRPRRFPAPAVAAVDTVGAGDTFCGALAACLARRLGIDAAVRIAVEAASLTVTRRGTQSSFPTAAEAAAILARQGRPG